MTEEKKTEKRIRAAVWYRENKERARETRHEYYRKHATRIKIQTRLWESKNKERVKELKRDWARREALKFPGRSAQRDKRHKLANPRAIKENKRKNYLKHRDRYRLLSCLRTRINVGLRKHGTAKKINATLYLLGCSIEDFRQHIEKQFSPGMGWHNHTISGWHIDHKRPCASFDLKDPEQQKQCFHYTNLQPLWALDNIRKGAKFES